MTRDQSVAYKVWSILLFAAGFILLRFSNHANSRTSSDFLHDIVGQISNAVGALFVGALGVIAMVIGCIVLVKSLGKVTE